MGAGWKCAGFVYEVAVPGAADEMEAAFFGEGDPRQGTRDLGSLDLYAAKGASQRVGGKLRIEN